MIQEHGYLQFLTPDTDGSASIVCRQMALPSFLWGYVSGVLGDLSVEENWFTLGDMTPEDTASIFIDAYDNLVEGCS